MASRDTSRDSQNRQMQLEKREKVGNLGKLQLSSIEKYNTVIYVLFESIPFCLRTRSNYLLRLTPS